MTRRQTLSGLPTGKCPARQHVWLLHKQAHKPKPGTVEANWTRGQGKNAGIAKKKIKKQRQTMVSCKQTASKLTKADSGIGFEFEKSKTHARTKEIALW